MRHRDLVFWVSIAGIAAAVFGLCQVMVSLAAWLFPVIPSPSTSNTPSPPTGGVPVAYSPQPELSIPLLSTFADFLQRLPRDTWPWLLTTIGFVLIAFGLWLLFQTRHYNFGENYAMILMLIGAAVGALIGYQIWGGWGGVLGFFVIGPMLSMVFTRANSCCIYGVICYSGGYETILPRPT